MRTGVVFVAVTGVSSCGLLPRGCARHRLLTTAEDLDNAHRAAALWAWFAQGERDDLGLWSWGDGLFRAQHAKKGTDLRDVGLAG